MFLLLTFVKLQRCSLGKKAEVGGQDLCSKISYYFSYVSPVFLQCVSNVEVSGVWRKKRANVGLLEGLRFLYFSFRRRPTSENIFFIFWGYHSDFCVLTDVYFLHRKNVFKPDGSGNTFVKLSEVEAQKIEAYSRTNLKNGCWFCFSNL